ncbi:MAG: hypothetical protein JRN20_03855 [Nitrososphaerota archaeon]|nr:hypothetical protein [Nitrososphaerota archaeon]
MQVKVIRALGIFTTIIGLLIMILSGVELILVPQDLALLAVMGVGFACIFGGMYVAFMD